MTDSDEELTLRLRNSVLMIDAGIAADADGVIEASRAALAAPVGSSVAAVKGDAADFARLVSFLDLELKGFGMHER